MPHSPRTLARTAGLRTVGGLEGVDRRRSQLWLLSLAVGVAVPATVLVLHLDLLPDQRFVDSPAVRLALVALLAAVLGYVAERERALRRLTVLLVDERVLTAALVGRVAELDLLLRASRAMNSSLKLDVILKVILEAASELLGATEGSVQLVCEDAPDQLEVVAVHGAATAHRGQRQPIGRGLAGRAAAAGEAVLVDGPHSRSPDAARFGAALVVPLLHRDQLVGVLNLASAVGHPPFTEFQQRAVTVAADTAAAAISNARLHETTEASVAALTELDRLKDEFLTLVTHELRTPLTSVIGLAQTIERGAGRLSGTQITDLARLISKQGWRLDRLVDDLLRTSQLQRGLHGLRPERLDVAALVRDAVAGLRPGAPGHILTVDVPPGRVEAVVDGDAVSRIVVNLVGNATAYTPSGSRIAVALEERLDGLALRVDDNGPGIPESQWEAVFEKFRRGGGLGSGGGLGLGLYLVRGLAEGHGGSVALGRSPGGGCRFTVTFPGRSPD